MDTLYAATRKGLFTWQRSGAGWEVADHAFVGDPVTLVLPDRRDGSLYAALDLGHFGPKMHARRAQAGAWEEIACPQMPEGAGDDLAVKVVWALAHGGDDQPGRVWAGTIPGGLFRSDDGGASWDFVESLWKEPGREKWFGGGFPDPGIHSICVHPEDSRRVVVGVSCGGVWETRDDGATWQNVAHGMIAEYMPEEGREDPDVQDPHQVVQCRDRPEVLWAQHHNGIFRRDEDEGRWTGIEEAGPSTFGFAVAVHPADPDVAWFVPAVKDECRIPVDGRLVVTRTRDGGRSFDVLTEGLPQGPAYDLVYRHALDVDDSGDRLAFGSTTGGLWVSEDGGDRWQVVSTHLPPVYAVRWAREAARR